MIVIASVEGSNMRTPAPYADAAQNLRQHGLVPIPVGGNDGKKPLVQWPKQAYGERAIASFINRHPAANVGVLCGLSGVTVVDIDDPVLLDAMLERFGETPLQTQTPRGGVHLWYRANGEANAQRLDGLAVDIRGIGGYVVVPPSVRPSVPYAGESYRFLKGGWEELPRLPPLKAGSLRARLGRSVTAQEGARNNALFAALLKQAPACDDLESLIDVAHTINADFNPLLTEAEVLKTAISAWGYEQRGENWSGSEARAMITASEHELLQEHPYALSLLLKLHFSHGARTESFAISAKAMKNANVMPGWGVQRYRQARDILLEKRFLACVFEGGQHQHAPSLYEFRKPSGKALTRAAAEQPVALPSRGPESEPNITKHPLPLQEATDEEDEQRETTDLFGAPLPSEATAADAFGAMVREARIAQGLSQRLVAQQLGLSRSAYGNIETGAYASSPQTMIRIREVLGLGYYRHAS